MLYSLSPEDLVVTPQPDWIKPNVANEVFEEHLGDISLLQPNASATIAQAFEAHYWVKSASRVAKASGAGAGRRSRSDLSQTRCDGFYEPLERIEFV